MDSLIENTKSLKKDSLVQLARTILESKYPTLNFGPNDYDITAWANKTEVLVKYNRLIKYVPKDKELSDFHYDFSVNLITKEVSPFDIWGLDRYYIPSSKDKKNIGFVNKVFGLPINGFENKVYEEDKMYVIEVDNEVSFGRYYIDKKTGKEAMPPLQGSYVPAPLPNSAMEDIDPLIEIKD